MSNQKICPLRASKDLIYLLVCHLLSDIGKHKYSFRNTLDLSSNRNELLECKINELFVKTEKLYLHVNDINTLEDILTVFSHHHGQSFYNLKILDFYNCEDLRYLFTVSVANGSAKLEKLTVSFCPILDVLVHDNGNGHGNDNGVEVIIFQKLKFLSLKELPNLVSLCNIHDVIKLPELVELILVGLPNFTSVYPGIKADSSFICNQISAIQPFFNKEVFTFTTKNVICIHIFCTLSKSDQKFFQFIITYKCVHYY